MKEHLTPEQLAQRKKSNKKIFIIIGIVLALALIGSLIPEDKRVTADPQSNVPARVTQSQFDAMTYEQKEAWIANAIKGTGSNITDAQIKMAQAVKSQFNYPEEVKFEFGEYPLLRNGDIVEADMGFVFLRGTGTAKNAFGVKSRFVYQIRTIVKPDTFRIDNVSVSELN